MSSGRSADAREGRLRVVHQDVEPAARDLTDLLMARLDALCAGDVQLQGAHAELGHPLEDACPPRRSDDMKAWFGSGSRLAWVRVLGGGPTCGNLLLGIHVPARGRCLRACSYGSRLSE